MALTCQTWTTSPASRRGWKPTARCGRCWPKKACPDAQEKQAFFFCHGLSRLNADKAKTGKWGCSVLLFRLKIGRDHVSTPVPNAQPVCRPLLEKQTVYHATLLHQLSTYT